MATAVQTDRQLMSAPPDPPSSLPPPPPRRVVPERMKLSQADAAEYYPVGPPYLMHTRDWAKVLDLWVALSPKVYRGHPSILAEMYGFCIAAAHWR